MTERRLSVFPPLAPGAYLRRVARTRPFPLDDPRCAVFELARQGLRWGVERLGVGPGDEILAPAYHHGSEIEALSATGALVRFYEATETLAPDPDELDALTSARTSALHLVHPLGFPQDSRRWRAWCDERRLALIEDAAQAWLSSRDGVPVGSVGDLAIFSLYKSVGAPDGGAVVSRDAAEVSPGAERLGLGDVARCHRRWLRQRGLPAPRPPRSAATQVDPVDDFAVGNVLAGPCRIGAFLLRRDIYADVAGRRRSNYARLLERLGPIVPRPFDELPAGASPFAFPVEVDRKSELILHLDAAGIESLDLWRHPHPSLPVGDFPAAAHRRDRIAGLPVHQDLSTADIERIAGTVEAYRSSAVPS